MFIVPWLTPPMNTYETVDIWVDSSCNGYFSDVGAKGLRYGVRSEPLHSMSVDMLVDAIGPTMQRYLVGDIG